MKRDSQLWHRVERGVGQATLVVIDPEPVAGVVRKSWEREGAVAGFDFTDDNVKSECAAAIVSGTPIAHLPNELATVSRWRPRANLDQFLPDRIDFEATSRWSEQFTPASIQQEIGDGLRAAQVFAARAHATFDVAALDDTVRSTRDAFRSPLARVILTELLSTPRVFDHESPKTADLLNRASEAIADRLREELPSISEAPLVTEHDSRSIDHLQAADIAAGWARETIDAAGVRVLGAMFERVWLNGFLMKTTHE